MFYSEYVSPEKLINNPDIIQLFQLVEKHGGVLRFVGGAVRDAIAGFKRTDIDLVTDMSPAEFSEMCDDEGLKCVPMGIQFYSMGVIVNDSLFKITSLSSEEDKGEDEWKKDAQNRDLTINAVYADNKGNVFDYFDGIKDLEKGIIKFIGNPTQTIEADYIRIMRFFRFCAMFGKNIDKKSLSECIKNKHLLKQISPEKIKDEFYKILKAPNAVMALNLIFENGILDFMLAPPKSLISFEKAKNLLRVLSFDIDFAFLLFILFEPNYKRAQRLAELFRLNKKEKEMLLNLSSIKISENDFKNTVKLNQLLCRYGKDFCKNACFITNIDTKEVFSLQETLNTVDSFSIPVFPISGKDLIKLNADTKFLGLYLDVLKKEWFESGCTLTQEGLVEKFKNIFQNPDLNKKSS